MCEMNVVLLDKGERSIFMESVVRMSVEGENIEMYNLFGERAALTGIIKGMDFSKGETIILRI